MILTYSNLIQIPTFEDRYRYLRLGGTVGLATFGMERYLNQVFYNTDEWKQIRRYIIVRDLGCDLGIPDREIQSLIFVHHMNPITKDDIVKRSKFLLDPEYLICCSKNTHTAIHYGDESLLVLPFVERTPYDTCPWKR